MAGVENVFNITENGVLNGYEGKDVSVIIPDRVKAIGTAFANNYDIRHVQMSDSDIKVIGNQAFWCSSIRTIDFPRGLIDIGDSAFRGSALEIAELPSGVKRIQRGAFMECIDLKKVSLPEGLEEIGHNAFQWCYELKEINIPSTVQKFGKSIFDDCKALKKLSCSDNFVIEADTFGKTLPVGLIGSLETLEKNMTTEAYQKYVLVEKVWSKLSLDTQVSFFIKRNTKGSLFEYGKCIKADCVDHLGISLLKKAEGKDSKDLNRAICNFLILFYDFSDKALMKKMLDTLKSRKNTEKLLAELEQSNLMTRIINEETVPSAQDADHCSAPTDLSYETIDSLPDDYYAGMLDFDVQNPIKAKLKKTIVSLDKQKFVVKFQSDQTMNSQLAGWLEDLYDPIYVINNNLFEERSEMVQYYNREQPEERQYILIKEEADHISDDMLAKRMMLFAKTVDKLQSEDVLRSILEMMPKKKNGALFLKRSVVIALMMITDKNFGFYALCAKAVKDAEAEIGLKFYSFGRIEEVLGLFKTVDEALGLIMKG